jgi:hypothetical protein
VAVQREVAPAVCRAVEAAVALVVHRAVEGAVALAVLAEDAVMKVVW